jgi:glycosyltransferase involved in cell wall biosynthesis
MTKVTVVAPVYGVENYIADTVRSVLAQEFEDFELLIVDDGSPDRSIEICREFDDSRIRILQQPNSGPATARNLGISQAKGEYIAFIDGDDLWHPEKLTKHVEHLDQNPQVGVSFCPSALIDEASNPLGIYQMAKLQEVTVLDWLCRTPIGNGSVPMMRKVAFEAIKFTGEVNGVKQVCYFNPDRQLHPSEDVECWLRIALTTDWRLEGIPDALTLYRVNSNGHSAKLMKKLSSWEQLLNTVRQYAPEEIAACEATAMAYQLRHLARRAVTLRDGATAVKLTHRALRTHVNILFEEPHRTLQTLLAAYLVWALPLTFYRHFETRAMQVIGVFQKQRMSHTA